VGANLESAFDKLGDVSQKEMLAAASKDIKKATKE